ncbi:MAG: NAD(P)-dependent glycerol-3-phosphate dehydrogenase [Ruminococcaceae bacterium]|nr:NAD(P)-dependent glycerol-3-phosphate dehydrogenase [Oscillospiraceae bacterium]
MKSIGILGAGTWGMALARMLANQGIAVTVWSALEKEIDEYSSTRVHPLLGGMVIPDSILFTKEIGEACRSKDVILFAVPSVFVRSTAAKAAPFIPEHQIIVDVAKGIEPETLYTMTEVIRSELQADGKHNGVSLAALSGPTHAEEVAKDMPTTIVSACRDHDVAVKVQNMFANTCMRVYTSTDVLGVELCGALKNIIALASGIAAGLGYGDNTRAALITRGMAEISRLGVAMGCSEATFHGLAGIGDLIVTATSQHSRNNRAGFLIGQGLSPEKAVKEVGMVVEGIHALPAALELAKRHDIQLPIIMGVDAIVNRGADPRELVTDLMTLGRRAFDHIR